MNPFAYDFFVRALWGALLTGLVTGIIGSYIAVRRMVFIAGGITHSSFAGLGFGFMTGISPVLCAMVSAVLAGIGVDFLVQKGREREDSAIAALWSLGMALGVVFLFLTPGYAPSLSAFLFGNILLVGPFDLGALSLFALLSISGVILFYRKLLYFSFDPDFARARGLGVRLWSLLMMVWFSVGIVLSIRVMGIMMLMSMLSLPQMTVNLFTSDFRKLLIGSALLSLLVVLAALFLSFYLNLPTGALSVILLSLVFLFSKAIRALRKPSVSPSEGTEG